MRLGGYRFAIAAREVGKWCPRRYGRFGVALLALHAYSLGLIPSGLNVALWTTHMTNQGLYDEQWLLVYEAGIRGWLARHGRLQKFSKKFPR